MAHGVLDEVAPSRYTASFPSPRFSGGSVKLLDMQTCRYAGMEPGSRIDFSQLDDWRGDVLITRGSTLFPPHCFWSLKDSQLVSCVSPWTHLGIQSEEAGGPWTVRIGNVDPPSHSSPMRLALLTRDIAPDRVSLGLEVGIRSTLGGHVLLLF
jgi:hypothetical protein